MKTKNVVWNRYKNILNQPEVYKNIKKCNFMAYDGYDRKRVYLADVMGLDHTEHPNCHIVLSLYYDTNHAMTIPFATKQDAWAYVTSKGKKDRRIVSKIAKSNGWKLILKGE